MILAFKQKFPWGKPTKFEQKIVTDGTKIHTIRADPHGRWKAGRSIQMAHGVRTKNYRCFKEDVCKSTQGIQINHYLSDDPVMKKIEIVIDGKLVFGPCSEIAERLAKNDGFDSVSYFLKWFNEDFSGKIIHWTNFRY